MKIQIIMSALIFSATIFAESVTAPAVSTEWTSVQATQFDEQLKKELSKQSKEIYKLGAQMINEKKEFSGDVKDKFDKSVDTVKAKEILYEKFQHAASLKYPNVRAKLLELFQKPEINENDLQELQTIVNQEKAKNSSNQ